MYLYLVTGRWCQYVIVKWRQVYKYFQENISLLVFICYRDSLFGDDSTMNALHLLNLLTLLHTDLRTVLLYAPVSHKDEARDAVEGRHAEVCHG